MAEIATKPEPPSRLRRRLLAGGLALGALGLMNVGPLARRLWPPGFEFEPLEDPTGFRRIAGGAVSGGFDPLAGVSFGAAPQPEQADPAALRAGLCGALFGADIPPGATPIASFSDYYCPYCRILTRDLAALAAEPGAALSIAWHEWPIFGEVSELAARAALAAKRQGAYLAYHEAMMRGRFVATPAFLADLARRLGIDPARMAADMESPEVAAAIATSRGLARLFAFAGTPALVVGRTVVVGRIDAPTLRALIVRERADGPPPSCV